MALHAEKESHFILALGIDRCISLFLPSQWEGVLRDLSERSTTVKNKATVRAFKRQLYGSAAEAPLDDQGRVLIPQVLVSYAKLRKDVTIIGVGNKAEIWDSAAWAAYEKKQAAPSFVKLAQAVDI